MAGIDKTYFKTYVQYREVIDWAEAQPTQYDSLGDPFHPVEWLPRYETYNDEEDIWTDHGYYTEEQVNHWLDLQRKENEKLKTIEHFESRKKSCPEYYPDNFDDYCKLVDSWPEIVLWNTPTYFDVYLIRNCQVQFIQERLKEQYGDEYEKIKNHNSVYDHYGIPAKARKISVVSKPNFKLRGTQRWFIDIYPLERGGIHWSYNKKHNRWVTNMELCTWDSSAMCYFGELSERKLVRWINHWKLPTGLKIEICGSYVGQGYTVITK